MPHASSTATVCHGPFYEEQTACCPQSQRLGNYKNAITKGETKHGERWEVRLTHKATGISTSGDIQLTKSASEDCAAAAMVPLIAAHIESGSPQMAPVSLS
jgi:hypothetical protein